MDRREFLRMAACSAAAASLSPSVSLVFAQDRKKKTPDRPRTLVVIYLRGGMDALHALVPYGDKTYPGLRPTLAVPAKDKENAAGVVALDDTFGLHPSLKALKAFWDSKKLAPIINVGSPHETRSHFDAQDFMEYAAPGMRTIKEGWLNRYLKATEKKAKEKADAEALKLRALAMQGLLPRALRGGVPVLAVPERHVLGNEKMLDTYKDFYGSSSGMAEEKRKEEDPALSAGQGTLETLERYKDLVEKRRPQDRGAKYPPGALAAKLRDIASVIHAEAGLEIAAVDTGGWDDHVNQGAGAGAMPKRMQEYADAVAAFAQDLGDKLDDTLMLTLSEFGRTCRENGSQGTDHGHGGLMFLLGGAVQGGKVHGQWTGLADKALYEGRDLPVTTDFRDVFAEVLRRHLRFDVPKDFFPNYRPTELKGLFV